MRYGVVVFPGTWSDRDCYHVLDAVYGQDVRYLWHKDTDLQGCHCLILPGGFSYGDYLRTGAIARFSPIMASVERHAARGGLVFGICNGFQILCEAGLLPGALMRNAHIQFRCQWVHLRVESTETPYTLSCKQGQVLHIPISHGEGNYYADEDMLRELRENGRIVFRYCTAQGDLAPEANPNGSIDHIAGIINKEGNVLGMMPHPERASEALLGGTDGRLIWDSLLAWASSR